MSNNSKKATLLTVILTAILAAAIVIGAIFGFNAGNTVADNNSITVSVNQATYNTKFDVIESECEKIFGSNDYSYQIQGEMSGDACEVVFVFDKGVNVKDLASKLNAKFDELTKAGGALEFSIIKAMANKTETIAYVAKDYVLRAAIATVLFAVLAFVYVAIRQKWTNAVAAALAVVFAATTTMALVLFARIPTTASTLYAVSAASLFAAIASVFVMNKECCAKKSIIYIFGGVAVAMLAVGIGGIVGGAWTNFWFSVVAILGIAVAAALGLCYVPAVCEALQPVADAQEAAKDKFAYKGASKTSTKKEKKAAAPAPVEEKACSACEKPCEEKVNAPVEEPVVEETTEEVVEEPVAEEPVVETTEEAPEEVAEATEETKEN